MFILPNIVDGYSCNDMFTTELLITVCIISSLIAILWQKLTRTDRKLKYNIVNKQIKMIINIKIRTNDIYFVRVSLPSQHECSVQYH